RAPTRPSGVTSARVEGFTVNRCGFAFPNAFPAVPVMSVMIPWVGGVALGNAANGLCGGMVFVAADFFAHQLTVPNAPQPPSAGTPLFQYIVRRLLDSFDLPLGPARYYEWMAMADGPVGAAPGVVALTRREWAGIEAE